MSATTSFVLPAIAVEAIGAHLPTFPQKLVVLADRDWDVSREADGRYAIRCSREAAGTVARLLQAAGRSPIASTEKIMACIGSAATILAQLHHQPPTHRTD